MSIEIIYERINETDKTVFFTLKQGNKTYKFHADVSLELEGTALLNHLKARKEEFFLLILRKMYREADISEFKTEKNTDLEAFQMWIQKGCTNPDGIVIEEKPWKSTHPSYIEIENEIESISNIPAKLKKVLKKMAKRLR